MRPKTGTGGPLKARGADPGPDIQQASSSRLGAGLSTSGPPRATCWEGGSDQRRVPRPQCQRRFAVMSSMTAPDQLAEWVNVFSALLSTSAPSSRVIARKLIRSC